MPIVNKYVLFFSQYTVDLKSITDVLLPDWYKNYHSEWETNVLKISRMLIVLGCLLAGTAVFAPATHTQGDLTNCPSIVTEAIAQANEACDSLGRNEACYGFSAVTALDDVGDSLDDFSTQGDIVNISQVTSLSTAAMQEDEGIWGIAFMALQANVPNTLPGQNVSFVLFGDTTIESDPTADSDTYTAPMQAFQLTTGIGMPNCVEAPRDGVLVQSPEGIQVIFSVNGIEVEMGSTVLLSPDVNDSNTQQVTVLEGQANITSDTGVVE